MGNCGHGGTPKDCDLCRQEGITGRSVQKNPPQQHSRTPGRRSGSPAPPLKGQGKKGKK